MEESWRRNCCGFATENKEGEEFRKKEANEYG
jgi:hypothetical protein